MDLQKHAVVVMANTVDNHIHFAQGSIEATAVVAADSRIAVAVDSRTAVAVAVDSRTVVVVVEDNTIAVVEETIHQIVVVGKSYYSLGKMSIVVAEMIANKTKA